MYNPANLNKDHPERYTIWRLWMGKLEEIAIDARDILFRDDGIIITSYNLFQPEFRTWIPDKDILAIRWGIEDAE